MAAYAPLDFYDLEDQLSEEERMVRDTVRAWVTARFLPVVGDHFEAGTFPMELVPELAELGVFGSNLPEEYGCAGLSNVGYGLICQELERGDSALPYSWIGHMTSRRPAGCRGSPAARRSAASA